MVTVLIYPGAGRTERVGSASYRDSVGQSFDSTTTGWRAPKQTRRPPGRNRMELAMRLSESLKRIVALIVLMIPSWGCQPEAEVPTRTFESDAFEALRETELTRPTHPLELLPPPPPPDTSTYGMIQTSCERFRVLVDERGHRRYKRERLPWSQADEKRFSGLIRLVAREMGADPRLFQAWAMRESTLRPSAIHVLNPDLEAASSAWRRFQYDPSVEMELEQTLQHLSPTGSEYWTTKARLNRVQTFRANAYLQDMIDYELRLSDGSTSRDLESIWAFGYGPFGFNPAYYLPVWDAKSPPWVFCGDDGLIAIVTAIWAARDHQRECEQAGMKGSYAVINRRFGSGHCIDPGPKPRFAARARKYGLNPNARARLGSKWPRATTNRLEFLDHLRIRAREEGLLAINNENASQG